MRVLVGVGLVTLAVNVEVIAVIALACLGAELIRRDGAARPRPVATGRRERGIGGGPASRHGHAGDLAGVCAVAAVVLATGIIVWRQAGQRQDAMVWT